MNIDILETIENKTQKVYQLTLLLKNCHQCNIEYIVFHWVSILSVYLICQSAIKTMLKYQLVYRSFDTWFS